MSAKIRIGFIGAGRMAHLHARLIAQEADVWIAAASDHGSGRAAELAAIHGGRAYSDYRRLLDETPLDAVYICTPTTTHAEIGLACAERNLHIFCEKPLDLDLTLAQRLVDEVERRNLLNVTCFQWRYSPGYLRAEEMIGDEKAALLHLHWYWTRPPIRWMWQRSLAGGQMVDQAIHLIDASQGLAGEIERVYAAYNSRQVNFEPEFDNWDGYALTLHYKSGAVGAYAGAYALFPEIQDGPALDICLRDRMVRLTDKGASLFTPQGVCSWENNEALHLGINRAFIAALRHNDPKPLRTSLRQGLHSTAVTLAANQSAHSGNPIEVKSLLR
jgi:predicted dehydrogenase